MAKRSLPSPETLRQLLRYEPETGKLFWRERELSSFKSPSHGRTWNNRYANAPALDCEDTKGYKFGSINKKLYRAHRVVWVIYNNEWPLGDIDHINGNRTDNKIINLREATRSQNIMNKKMQSNNTSGIIGVYYHKASGKWMARVYSMGNCRYLGLFSSKIDAMNAYENSAKADHSEFAFSNRPKLT